MITQEQANYFYDVITYSGNRKMTNYRFYDAYRELCSRLALPVLYNRKEVIDIFNSVIEEENIEMDYDLFLFAISKLLKNI